MSKPDLKDPRKMYHTEESPKQHQDKPALQSEMRPKPDCGEETYEGHGLLLDRKALVIEGIKRKRLRNSEEISMAERHHLDS